MWTDLNLAPFLKSCDHHAEGFRLHFGLRKHTGPCPPPRLSKVLATMQVAPEHNPPPTIPRAQLSTLHVSLEYRRPSPAMQLAVSLPQHGKLIPHHFLETNILETHKISNVSQQQSEVDTTLLRIPRLAPISLSLQETSFVDELHHIGEESHSSEISYAYITPPQIEVLPVQPKDFYTLFNCGFKSLLTGSRHQNSNQDEGLQSLSQTVPQVFSPGYRDVSGEKDLKSLQLTPIIGNESPSSTYPLSRQVHSFGCQKLARFVPSPYISESESIALLFSRVTLPVAKLIGAKGSNTRISVAHRPETTL